MDPDQLRGGGPDASDPVVAAVLDGAPDVEGAPEDAHAHRDSFSGPRCAPSDTTQVHRLGASPVAGVFQTW